jgi:hypothetical protein
MPQQINPDELIGILNAEYQARAEPNFALAKATSTFLALPVLRGFWPTSSVVGGPTVAPGGNLNDISGNGLLLTYTGNPLYGIDELAPYADFDGTGDYFTRAGAGVNDPLDLLGTETYVDTSLQGMSIGCWVNVDAYANDDGIITKGDIAGAAPNINYGLELFTVPNRFRLWIGTGAGAAVVSTATTTTGTWYFVVGRFNHTTKDIDIFVNGVFATPVATGLLGGLQNNNSPFNLGTYNNNATYCLDGRISMAFACASFISNAHVRNLYHQTRTLYNV